MASFSSGADDQDAATDTLHTILPPPQVVYPSHDEAEAAIHAWARDHGYNLSRRRRYLDDQGDVICRHYECDQAGRPKNTRKLIPSARRRQMRGSKRSGCPMTLTIRACGTVDNSGASTTRNLDASAGAKFSTRTNDPQPRDGDWKVWHTWAGSALHNHLPAEDVRVFVCHRQRAAAAEITRPHSESSLISDQTAAGVSTSSILASILHGNPNSLTTDKDIANSRNAERRRDLHTQTSTEALFSKLREHDFFYRFAVDNDNRLRYLFWSHPDSMKFYKRHPEVIIMDCTYKTNEYDAPLLNIIAMTGMNTILPIAQCWLPGEKQEDFEWAFQQLQELRATNEISNPTIILTDRDLACMNALDVIFPSTPAMICRWHMNRNVLAKVRRVLGQIRVEDPAPWEDKHRNTLATDIFMAAYHTTVNSDTEADFDKNKSVLQELNAELSSYLDLHWWKYKERVVKCWTKQYLHFGFQDTSPVEGTHAKCKYWLKTSRGDLYTAFNKLLPWWTKAIGDVSLAAERNSKFTPYALGGAEYSAVVRIITIHALRETNTMWQDATQMLHSRIVPNACSGDFRRVHGRPCLHELYEIIKSNGLRKLKPNDFHLHWWIRRDVSVEIQNRILEPIRVTATRPKRRKRRKHQRNYGIYSTRRDPTLAERVDLNHPSSPPSQRPLVTYLQSSTTQNPNQSAALRVNDIPLFRSTPALSSSFPDLGPSNGIQNRPLPSFSSLFRGNMQSDQHDQNTVLHPRWTSLEFVVHAQSFVLVYVQGRAPLRGRAALRGRTARRGPASRQGCDSRQGRAGRQSCAALKAALRSKAVKVLLVAKATKGLVLAKDTVAAAALLPTKAVLPFTLVAPRSRRPVPVLGSVLFTKHPWCRSCRGVAENFAHAHQYAPSEVALQDSK